MARTTKRQEAETAVSVDIQTESETNALAPAVLENNHVFRWNFPDLKARLLEGIQKWYFHQHLRDVNTWSTLTTEVLTKWIRNGSGIGSTIVPAVSPSASVVAPNIIRDIKASVSDYPTLKEDKFWQSWNRSVKSKARAHGMEQVLAASWIPNTDAERNHDIMCQNFMYDVFIQAVQTAKGRQIV